MGLMTEEEKTQTLERTGKKGAVGVYIRQSYIKGKGLVDDEMAEEAEKKKAKAQEKKDKAAAKKAAVAEGDDDTLESSDGKKNDHTKRGASEKRGKKRPAPSNEVEGETGLEDCNGPRRVLAASRRLTSRVATILSRVRRRSRRSRRRATTLTLLRERLTLQGTQHWRCSGMLRQTS